MQRLQMVVYPNQIPIPLMENSGLPKPPVGMLELTILRCHGLRSKDVVGPGDPYVRVSVLTMGTSTDKHGKEIEIVAKEDPPHQTEVKHSKNPEFKEHFKARPTLLLLLPFLICDAQTMVFLVRDRE